LRLQITDDGVDVDEQLVDEGHHLAHLDLDELPAALLRDLDERVASHVLKNKKQRQLGCGFSKT
jgi:hypothetical protein